MADPHGFPPLLPQGHPRHCAVCPPQRAHGGDPGLGRARPGSPPSPSAAKWRRGPSAGPGPGPSWPRPRSAAQHRRPVAASARPPPRARGCPRPPFLPSFLPRDLCVLFYLGLVACISPPCVALGGGVSHREGCRGREQRETEAGMKEKEEGEETRDLIRALRQNWDAVTFCVSVSDFNGWQEPCVSGDATQEWLQSWFLHQ